MGTASTWLIHSLQSSMIHLQRHFAWPRLDDGFDRLLLPPHPKFPRALQGRPLFHRPRDLHRRLPLLPDLQQLRRGLHSLRGRRRGRQSPQVRCRHLRIPPTGHAFNDAYRYVDWFLTVPLLLIEIVLVMKLSEAETFSQSLKLGFFSALMILNGYPGEVSSAAGTRWVFWFLSMIPFCYIVYTLFIGLKASQDAQPEACKEQVKWACCATVISWCTYPIVFILPMISGSEGGKSGLSASSMVMVQVG